MIGFVQGLLESQLSLTPGLAEIAAHGIGILAALVVGGIAALAARRVLVLLATHVAMRTETQWDDALIESGALGRLAPLAPSIACYVFSSAFGSAQGWVEALLLIYMAGIVLRVIDALLDTCLDIYGRSAGSREIPLRGVVQLARVGLVVLGVIFVISTAVERGPALVGSQLDALLRADRADDTEDIHALLERAREALVRVRDDGTPLPVEGERFLREVRERSPALLDAVARRVAEIAEAEEPFDPATQAVLGDRGRLSERLRELCELVNEAGTTTTEAPAEFSDPEASWPALAESCRKIDAALDEAANRAAVPRESRGE